MQQSHQSHQVLPKSTSSSSPLDALGLWIEGTTRSGKTTRLIQQFSSWVRQLQTNPGSDPEFDPELGYVTSQEIHPQISSIRPCLFFAASGSNRQTLAARLATLSGQIVSGQIVSEQSLSELNRHILLVTPISFFQAEVIQNWPALMQQLGCQASTPLRLRPEKEQELATRLWQPELSSGRFRQAGVSDPRLVNRTLSLLQLAAASGIAHEQIPLILQQGLPESEPAADWDCAGTLLERWWRWCLERGLITYSLITELYWRYLLPQPAYQAGLGQRFGAIWADDVDEYPAVMRSLLEHCLDQGIPVTCTFNPIGAVRLGLRADPNYLVGFASRCQVEQLAEPTDRLGAWSQPILDCIHEPLNLLQLPDSIRVIQTVSKAQLLRQVADLIAAAIAAGDVKPQEIAIIAPGLDAITRYTLQSILSRRQIPLLSLNSQQPLISSSWIRALLSLMALVYPGQGGWLDRESVAEMLVVLAQAEGLDPVRAGLLADHCFAPDLGQPQLLAITEFPRWDRLGYQATAAYEQLIAWLEASKAQPAQPPVWLEQAIQQFFPVPSSPDQATSLQQLVETAQHYWEVEVRLSPGSDFAKPALSEQALSEQVSQFIQLLRSGTITANPTASPESPEFENQDPGDATSIQPDAAITLATVYQYRSAKCSHRWQFWLDAGSAFWLTGGVMLFGAPLFWQGRPQQVWTAADSLVAAQTNLDREVADLLHRATERIYLCYCELGINGEEQSGALMPLVNAALPIDEPTHATPNAIP